jgi:hypothetical protein
MATIQITDNKIMELFRRCKGIIQTKNPIESIDNEDVLKEICVSYLEK